MTGVLMGVLAVLGSLGSIHDAPKYDCLPKEVRLEEVVTHSRNAKDIVTVEKKLKEVKARCRKGKLVDGSNKEIRFFRVSCWGNPPPDYLEIKQKENEEFEKLKKDYTVVVFGCNPRIH